MADGGNMVKLVVQLLADAKAFAGELDTAASAVKKMADTASGDLTAVGTDVSMVMDTAAADVSAAMDAASADVTALAVDVSTAMDETAADVTTALDSAATDVTTLADGVEAEMKEVSEETAAAGDAMAKDLGAGAAAAGDAIEKGIEEGAAEAIRAVDKIPEKNQGAWSRMGDAANAAGSKISEGMKRAAGDTSLSFREATNKVSEDVGAMASKIGTSMVMAGGAILGALAIMANGSREVNNILGELSTAGIQDLNAVKDAAQEFSNQWAGVSAPDFIESAGAIKAAVAQLSDDAVISFTKAANLTAKATKSTADEMADLFGKAYAIYKPLTKEMSDVEWAERFGGAMTGAANAFNTSGAEMASSIRSIGAAATSLNVPLSEQLGILGTLQATMSGAEAGTLYKSFLTRAASAGKMLNLQFTNANGTLKTTPEILKLIQQKFPDISKAAAQVELNKAFGAEGTKLVAQLIPQMDLLEQGIADVATGWERAAEETEESAEKMNTDKIALAAQQFGNLKGQIGALIMEGIAPFLEKISEWALRAQEWVAANKPLVNTLIKVAAVIGAVLVVVGTLLLIFAAAAGAVALFTSAAAATIGAGIAAIFTATGLLIAGIVAAVIAAGVAVLVYWEEVRDFFLAAWDIIKETAVTVWNAIVSVLSTVVKSIILVFTKMWEGIKALFSKGWDVIVSVFTAVVDKIKSIAQAIWDAFTEGLQTLRDAWESWFEKLQNLWDGFWDKLSEGWEAAKAGPEKFAAWLVDSIREAVEKCKEFLMGLWGDIKALPGKLWDAVTGGGDGPAPAGGSGTGHAATRNAARGTLPAPGAQPSALMGAAAAASASSRTGGGGDALTTVGEIHIHQQPNQSPQELLKELARELQFRRGGRT